MGAFDEKPPIILPDPNDPEESAKFREKWGWEPHEQVILRGEYTAGHMQEVNDVATVANIGADASTAESTVSLRSGTLSIELMRVLIIDWTFARNGQKVPVSIHTIKQLPTQYMTPILEVCNRLTSGSRVSVQKQNDFLTSAREPTSGSSTSMKPHHAK